MNGSAWFRRAAALGAAATSLVACGSESSPPPSSLCPSDMEPTFASIDEHLLSKSCGTDGSTCHSAEGSLDSGELDLQSDPYGSLLGSGSGAPASNIAGSARGLVRVSPGKPDESFLVIKLRTKTLADPSYGAGMPRTAPGALCESALSAVEEWIRNGAAR